MNVHELKTQSPFFEPLRMRLKTFEVRRNDRHFAVGDKLVLRHYNNDIGYTGEVEERLVTYIFDSEDMIALLPGYVVLGLV